MKQTKLGWVLRDMMQSTGVWTFDTEAICQLARIACSAGLHHLEIGGGQSFQVALQHQANPYQLLRGVKRQLDDLDRPMPLQILLRGANQFGFHHYSQAVQRKNLDLLIEAGGDADKSRALIIRIFDALNDVENLRFSIEYIVNNNKQALQTGGKQAALQVALSYVAPVSDAANALYSVNYYVSYAKKLRAIAQQAGGDLDALCIKDMSGQLNAQTAASLVQGLQALSLPITLHCHSTDEAKSLAAMLSAAQSGVDTIEVAIKPLAGGASHHDIRNLQGFSFIEELDNHALNHLEAACCAQFGANASRRKDFQLPMACLKALCDLGVPGGAIPFIVHDLQSQVCRMLGIDMNAAIEVFSQELERLQSLLGRVPLVTPTADIIAKQVIKNLGNRSRPAKYKMMDPRFCALVLGDYGDTINHATDERIAVDHQLVDEVREYLASIEPDAHGVRIKSGKRYPDLDARNQHPSRVANSVEFERACDYVAELAYRYPESVERFGSRDECVMMQVMRPAGNTERLLTRNILGPTEQRLQLLLDTTLRLLPAQKIPEARAVADNETTDLALLKLLGDYEGIIGHIKGFVMRIEQGELESTLQMLKDRIVGSYCDQNREARAHVSYVERRFVALFAAAVFWDLQRICRRTGADSREGLEEATANSLGRIISVTLRRRKEAGLGPADSYLV